MRLRRGEIGNVARRATNIDSVLVTGRALVIRIPEHQAAIQVIYSHSDDKSPHLGAGIEQLGLMEQIKKRHDYIYEIAD